MKSKGFKQIGQAIDRTAFEKILNDVRQGNRRSVEEAFRFLNRKDDGDEQIIKTAQIFHREHQSCYLNRGSREYAIVNYLEVMITYML